LQLPHLTAKPLIVKLIEITAALKQMGLQNVIARIYKMFLFLSACTTKKVFHSG
jgi:hypothetical protein